LGAFSAALLGESVELPEQVEFRVLWAYLDGDGTIALYPASDEASQRLSMAWEAQLEHAERGMHCTFQPEVSALRDGFMVLEQREWQPGDPDPEKWGHRLVLLHKLPLDAAWSSAIPEHARVALNAALRHYLEGQLAHSEYMNAGLAAIESDAPSQGESE